MIKLIGYSTEGKTWWKSQQFVYNLLTDKEKRIKNLVKDIRKIRIEKNKEIKFSVHFYYRLLKCTEDIHKEQKKNINVYIKYKYIYKIKRVLLHPSADNKFSFSFEIKSWSGFSIIINSRLVWITWIMPIIVSINWKKKYLSIKIPI